MRVIKSTLIGARLVRASEPNIQLFQIRNVLDQHRDALVDRVLADLPTYIDFKFRQQPSRKDLALIFDRLLAFKRRSVDIDFYQPLIKEIMKKEETKLKNDCFFLEIDEQIKLNLNPQLNFAA